MLNNWKFSIINILLLERNFYKLKNVDHERCSLLLRSKFQLNYFKICLASILVRSVAGWFSHSGAVGTSPFSTWIFFECRFLRSSSWSCFSTTKCFLVSSLHVYSRGLTLLMSKQKQNYVQKLCFRIVEKNVKVAGPKILQWLDREKFGSKEKIWWWIISVFLQNRLRVSFAESVVERFILNKWHVIFFLLTEQEK